MKQRILFYVVFALTILSLGGCKKVKTPEAALEREKWIAGFTDSVDYYKKRSEQLQQQLDIVNNKINGLLGNFEYIKKPREVTGYYLLKGWSKKNPLYFNWHLCPYK